MMNILVAVNKKYKMPLQVMLTSLLENNRDTEHINIFLMHSFLDTNDIEDVRNTVMKYDNAELNVIHIDEEKFSYLKVTHHFSIETYYRLLMQKLLPDNVDRILWLDSDIIIKGSLKDFYNQNIENCYIGVCQSINKNPKELLDKLCLYDRDKYFNAGIVLFNLDLLRKEIDCDYYFKYIKENTDKITWLDQDVLNATLGGKAVYSDYMIYNMQHFTNAEFNSKIKKVIKNDTIVLHYIGAVKPWNENYVGFTAQYWWKYAKIAGVASYFKDVFLKHPKTGAKNFIKNFLY